MFKGFPCILALQKKPFNLSKPDLSLQLCPYHIQTLSMSLLLSLVPTLGTSLLLMRFSVNAQKVRELVSVKSPPRTELPSNAIIPWKSMLAEKLTVYFLGMHPMVMLDAVNMQRHNPPPTTTLLKSILNANSVFFCSINGKVGPLMCTHGAYACLGNMH